MSTPGKLTKPLLISNLFKIGFKFLLKIRDSKLTILILILLPIQHHLKLLEPLVLLLALAHLFLHLLFLYPLHFNNILNEFFGEANAGEEAQLAE